MSSYQHTTGGMIEEVHDLDVPHKLWNGPGHPPLLLIEPEDKALALEPLEGAAIAPRSVRPGAGDRWLDMRAGYGAFSMLAKRCGVDLIVPIEPDPVLADLAGRAMFLEGMPAPAATDVTSITLEEMVDTLELNALRLDGAPWLPIADLPLVRKVIERSSAGKVAARKETLENLFANVLVSRVHGWGECYLFAWGRYGSGT